VNTGGGDDGFANIHGLSRASGALPIVSCFAPGKNRNRRAHKHMARLLAGVGPWSETEDLFRGETLLREAAAGHQTEQPDTH
jgi:hypothetical protein